MAPLKRRGRQEQRQAGANTTSKGRQQRGGRGNKSGGNSDKTGASQDSDDDTPSYNVVSICMQFQESYGKQHRSKSDKLVEEASKIANEYTRSVEDALLVQEKELSATYEAFVQATSADLEERQNILKQLSDNYVALENLRQKLANRCIAYDKKRHAGVAQHIEKAEKETSVFNCSIDVFG